MGRVDPHMMRRVLASVALDFSQSDSDSSETDFDLGTHLGLVPAVRHVNVPARDFGPATVAMAMPTAYTVLQSLKDAIRDALTPIILANVFLPMLGVNFTAGYTVMQIAGIQVGPWISKLFHGDELMLARALSIGLSVLPNLSELRVRSHQYSDAVWDEIVWNELLPLPGIVRDSRRTPILSDLLKGTWSMPQLRQLTVFGDFGSMAIEVGYQFPLLQTVDIWTPLSCVQVVERTAGYHGWCSTCQCKTTILPHAGSSLRILAGYCRGFDCAPASVLCSVCGRDISVTFVEPLVTVRYRSSTKCVVRTGM